MASPLKPWERNNTNSINNGFNVNSSATTSTGNGAPPLPPRPNQAQNFSNISNYGNRFSSPYSYSSPYGSYCNPYHGGNFGYFGSGMGGYGYGNPPSFGNEMSLFRFAEESSHQAFQSIESIVQAFSSISMLLESTYFALRNSFQAIIGVADNFSTLKNQLASILSTLAVIRMMKKFINYVLYLLGQRTRESLNESIWAATNTSNSQINNDGTLLSDSEMAKVNTSKWPLMVFFSLVCGTPWLIWKVFGQSNEQNKLISEKWMTGNDVHYAAIASYDFQAESEKELSFKSGDAVRVAPKHLQPNIRGWLLASVNNKSGLVPANRIHILDLINPNESESREPLTE